jgi:hypothetical protein
MDHAGFRTGDRARRAVRCVLEARVACRRAWALASLALLAWAALAAAQAADTSRERVRVIRERASEQGREEALLRLPGTEDLDLEVGGWTSLTYLNIQDDDRDRATLDTTHGLLIQDYRLWMTSDLTRDLRSYLRMRHLLLNFYTQPGAAETDTRSQEGIELDLAYLDYEANAHLRLRGGRQFVTVGRGLVLALDLDGLEVTHALADWTYRLFAGQTVPRDFNIDDSILGFSRQTQKRRFYFAEVEHRRIDGTKYTAYVLAQDDRSRTLEPLQASRPFRYESHYASLGVEGDIDPRLGYSLEAVYQGGSSMVDILPSPRVRIDAWALLAGLEYHPRGPWHPEVSLEYAAGSGDATRASVTNTFGGKLRPTRRDTNFLYFGVYDGGLDLSPRLSNLHVIRLGYQVKPLPSAQEDLPELSVGVKLSRYFKDETRGGISDLVAGPLSTDVGTGADVFVAARPLSDYTILAQYGLFVPGDTYPARFDDRGSRFLVTSTLSF